MNKGDSMLGGQLDGKKRWGDTTSKKGEQSRVFVGNTDPRLTTCDDLVSKFKHYGEIEGVDINPNGFAFVQFSSVGEAQRAVMGENGTILRGKKIELRMFDKSGPPRASKRQPGDRSRSPMNRGPTGATFHGHQGYGSNLGTNHGVNSIVQAGPPQMGNDIEIIVVNRDQWAYAEIVEQRIRQEAGVKYIDLLFLHSPQHLTMTLNDLFERRTMVAIVIEAINEEHKSVTLHILHNQTEHRNMPLDEALQLITKDITGGLKDGLQMGLQGYGSNAIARQMKPMDNFGVSNRFAEGSNGSLGATYSTSLASGSNVSDKHLPQEIADILRATLQDGGVQFLSLSQIDSVIDYYSRERDRLTAQAARHKQQQQSSQLISQANQSSYDFNPNSYQSQQMQSMQSSNTSGSANSNQNNLLENPHVKAALNSLLQIGAIGSNVASAASNLSGLQSLATSLSGSMSGPQSGSKIMGGQSSSASLPTSEAPSYLSTSASSSAVGHDRMMNQTSSSQQTIPGQLLQNARRHPLLDSDTMSVSRSGDFGRMQTTLPRSSYLPSVNQRY